MIIHLCLYNLLPEFRGVFLLHYFLIHWEARLVQIPEYTQFYIRLALFCIIYQHNFECFGGGKYLEFLSIKSSISKPSFINLTIF